MKLSTLILSSIFYLGFVYQAQASGYNNGWEVSSYGDRSSGWERSSGYGNGYQESCEYSDQGISPYYGGGNSDFRITGIGTSGADAIQTAIQQASSGTCVTRGGLDMYNSRVEVYRNKRGKCCARLHVVCEEYVRKKTCGADCYGRSSYKKTSYRNTGYRSSGYGQKRTYKRSSYSSYRPKKSYRYKRVKRRYRSSCYGGCGRSTGYGYKRYGKRRYRNSYRKSFGFSFNVGFSLFASFGGSNYGGGYY